MPVYKTSFERAPQDAMEIAIRAALERLVGKEISTLKFMLDPQVEGCIAVQATFHGYEGLYQYLFHEMNKVNITQDPKNTTIYDYQIEPVIFTQWPPVVAEQYK